MNTPRSSLCSPAVRLLVILAAPVALSHPAFMAAAVQADAKAAEEGSSFETAVVIHAEHESEGVKAEYAWIGEHIPGGKSEGQALLNHGGKPYDLIHVRLPDDTVRDVYFDISGFFGKM